MSELELQLQSLGRELAFPPVPELAARVRARIGRPARRSFFGHRRPLAIALAVLAVALGAALVVPPARTALLEWLGIGAVDVRFVDELPAVAPVEDLALGERVSLDEARRRLPETVVPALEGLGPPDEVYYRLNGQVSLLWGSPESVRLLMTQIRGEAVIEKFVARDTDASILLVNGDTGIWLSGAPHVFAYRDERGRFQEDTMRLVKNALIWQQGSLTLRLEGDLTKADALRVARSVR